MAKSKKINKNPFDKINKDLLDKMINPLSTYSFNSKIGKFEKKPDFNTITKKFFESIKNKQAKAVKSKIESLKKPEIRKKTIKKEVVVKPKKLELKKEIPKPKVNAPTVSQLWQQKTGTSWSEAKKQGLTDGSATSNIALMKKLKSGEINKSSLSKPKTETAPTPVTTTTTPTPTPKPTPYAGSGMGAMERADREFEEQGFRRGGSVRKMRKNRMKKK